MHLLERVMSKSNGGDRGCLPFTYGNYVKFRLEIRMRNMYFPFDRPPYTISQIACMELESKQSNDMNETTFTD